MKKIIFLLLGFIILNGCAQSTSFLGPSYTLAKTGSISHAGTSVLTGYAMKKAANVSSEEIMNSIADKNIRECKTVHSAELNEIFFETLDEIDCYRNPLSILR